MNDRSNIAKEMSTMDFGTLLTGPLVALVRAEFKAAMTTAHFVINVGFKSTAAAQNGTAKNIGDTVGDPVIIRFSYPEQQVFGLSNKRVLEVPLLTMLPIPMLRIQEATVEFNVHITDTFNMTSSLTNSSQQAGSSVSGGNTTGNTTLSSTANNNTNNFVIDNSSGTSTIMQSNITNKSTTKRGFNVQREYNLKVKVLCVQDELPAGLERLMGMLEGQMKAKASVSDLMTQTIGGAKLGGTASGAASPTA